MESHVIDFDPNNYIVKQTKSPGRAEVDNTSAVSTCYNSRLLSGLRSDHR